MPQAKSSREQTVSVLVKTGAAATNLSLSLGELQLNYLWHLPQKEKQITRLNYCNKRIT